ncbi:SPOR domain-containing protein [Clostridium tetani]|nr:SPOR domain-containing protein [Clostridium tetani]
MEDDKLYRVQVGAFKDKDNADKLRNELKNKGFNGFIKE